MNGREKQQQLQASGMNNPKKKAVLPSTLTLAKRINNTVIKSLQHTYACANPNWESCIFLLWFASDCAWHRRTHNSAKPKVDQKRGGQTRNLHCDNRMIEEASSRQPQQWQIMHCCKLQLYPSGALHLTSGQRRRNLMLVWHAQAMIGAIARSVLRPTPPILSEDFHGSLVLRTP